MLDKTTETIMLKLLRDAGVEVYEEPKGCWNVIIGSYQGGKNVSIWLGFLELTSDFKWVQLKKKTF
jgi:hypothetical protein